MEAKTPLLLTQSRPGEAGGAGQDTPVRAGGALAYFVVLLQYLKAYFDFMAQLRGALSSSSLRAKRPWHLHTKARHQTFALKDSEVNRLLKTQCELKDMEQIAEAIRKIQAQAGELVKG